MQQLADELQVAVRVCHFPRGTGKWNQIEHRMFCHITQNWRGRPLVSREVVVDLIGNASTATGLRVQAQLDDNALAKYFNGHELHPPSGLPAPAQPGLRFIVYPFAGQERPAAGIYCLV